MRSGFSIVPCSLAEANFFVAQHHRHHGEVTGHKFSLALASGDCIRGVTIVGRPVARRLDDGWTLEVLRGHRWLEKRLLGPIRSCLARCRALGYRQLVTYTLASEPSTSLIAAGWTCIGKAGGGSWSRASRPRIDTHPLQGKIRWQTDIVDAAVRKAAGALKSIDDSRQTRRRA